MRRARREYRRAVRRKNAPAAASALSGPQVSELPRTVGAKNGGGMMAAPSGLG
jgi:hypothetical protein